MTARGDGATARQGDDAATRRDGAPTVMPLRKCVECGRVFNLNFTEDAEEWFYGHDCET